MFQIDFDCAHGACVVADAVRRGNSYPVDSKFQPGMFNVLMVYNNTHHHRHIEFIYSRYIGMRRTKRTQLVHIERKARATAFKTVIDNIILHL